MMMMMMMMMDNTCKGQFVTANFTSHGPMVEFLKEATCEIVTVQEHRATGERLPDVQSRCRDAGYHGIWATAIPTDAGDSSGGVAVLAKSNITISAPPGRPDPVMEEGRMVGGHFHYGVTGGIVMISVYLRTGEGMSAANLASVWRLCEYLMELNSRGYAWMVGGDFQHGV